MKNSVTYHLSTDGNRLFSFQVHIRIFEGLVCFSKVTPKNCFFFLAKFESNDKFMKKLLLKS